jgi:hypothetical protein
MPSGNSPVFIDVTYSITGSNKCSNTRKIFKINSYITNIPNEHSSTCDYITKGIYYVTSTKHPPFMSPSYKARCAKIQCKYGDKCIFKDNTYGRICYFKH